MIEFFVGCTAAYFFFRLLDALFNMNRLPKLAPGRKRSVIKDGNGQYWIVEEDIHEAPEKVEAPDHGKPDLRVVK